MWVGSRSSLYPQIVIVDLVPCLEHSIVDCIRTVGVAVHVINTTSVSVYSARGPQAQVPVCTVPETLRLRYQSVLCQRPSDSGTSLYCLQQLSSYNFKCDKCLVPIISPPIDLTTSHSCPTFSACCLSFCNS